ncbi:MAG: GNAT family N-acetyltransferase, partial [Methylococcales bacterium]
MVNQDKPKTSGRLTKPERLKPEHDISEFNSGIESLDHWLYFKTLHNDQADASRTYVVCEDNQVIAYYCLSTGSVSRSEAAGTLRRNMPDPLPVMILGRLAVDLAWQRHGIGAALLQDALLRTIQVSDIAGVKALLVHAISDQAATFYQKWGSHPSPINPKILF